MTTHWIEPAWMGMVGASLTLGLIHLFVWFKQPDRYAYLAFFVVATAVAGFGVAELGMMRAQAPGDYAAALRWGQIPLSTFVVAAAVFVWLYFDAGRPWVIAGIAGLRALTLALNFTTGVNVNFAEVSLLEHVSLWGDSVSVSVGTANRWAFVPQLSNALLLVFVVDASLTAWRRGRTDARRRVAVVGGSLVATVAPTAGFAALIVAGVVHAPTTLTPAFVMVVVAVSYELGRDVMRAARLAVALQESEARLRESEERMRGVVEATPSAILLVDAKGAIILANAQAETIFGYARAELLGRAVDDLLPARLSVGHEAHRRDFPVARRPRAMGSGRDLVARRKDGTEFPIDVGMAPLQTIDGDYVLVSLVDITERRTLERAAAMQRDELAHMSRVAMLGELSGALAHELNQPLTAILSNAQAAQRFLGRDPPDLPHVAEVLADIVQNDRRAVAVIERLRSLLRKEEARFEPLDINDVVEDSLRMLRTDLGQRHVTVEADLASQLPPVRGDRVQLQQVLLNLIINGCDAMEQDQPDRHLAVRTGAAANGGVEVAVADRGAGIAPGELARIFEPFVTTKSHGLGLGLPLCKTIIEAHAGKMWASNNPDRGATFRFELPATEDVPA